MKRRLVALVARAYEVARDLHWTHTTDTWRSRYDLDPGFRFNGQGSLLYGDGEIVAGPGSYIGWYSFVQAAAGHEVRIGRGCRISHGIRIYTSTPDADADQLDPAAGTRSGNVVIGDGAWIGAGVYIGPGITIGENSVVGANSVVTRDVEPWTIVGGVPARFIRAKTSKPASAAP